MTISITDHAEEFKIEISGRFLGAAVEQAASTWRAALALNTPRRISVDITRMTGYDQSGYLLLREIYLHGTNIAARTPTSLGFLTQISAPQPVADFSRETIVSKRQVTSQALLRYRSISAGE